MGDGTDEVDGSGNKVGMCQQEDSDRRCLSTGECRRCKFVAGTGLNRYEGCVITSDAPICDANASTDEVEFATDNYLAGTTPNPGHYPDGTGYMEHSLTPNCVKCKKKGMI